MIRFAFLKSLWSYSSAQDDPGQAWIQPGGKPLKIQGGCSHWKWKEMDTFQRYLGHRANRTRNVLDTRITARKSSRRTPKGFFGQPDIGRQSLSREF